MLEIKNLSVIYSKDDSQVKAVDSVSFVLDDGNTLGIIGESGSGKSTVALSILKLISPPGHIVSGEIFWDGRDILKLNDSDLRALRGSDIAMIFQDPFSSLNPVFTIGDQVGEAVRVHQGVRGQGLGTRVKELLKTVHLNEDLIHKYPHELSGGMRQRAMIAMALAGNPKLLIADEPTTALDVTIQAEIFKLLKEIQEKFKMGIILITHNLALASGFCDSVIIMKKGRIEESGQINNIFRNSQSSYTRELIDAIPKPRW